MFTFIWHTFFFDPVYNTLVFFIDIFPNGDVGLAIIATVVIVKFLLFPLSIKAVKTQKIMREIDPKLREIKEKYKDKREELAKATMEIYREAGMNPFASIGVMFLQIPFIIALYLAVSNGGGVSLPGINLDILYSFVSSPSSVSMNFLGFFDITSKSIVLALTAGILQYINVRFAMPKPPARDPDAAPSFKADFSRNMHMQMLYVMPVIIVMTAYALGSTIALYFVVSNIMTIAQEYFVKKHR
jgi:YidC/Oxa1 family membrane protein insertase